MKKHLLVLGLAAAMAFGSASAQAKSFTWTASTDALSMDPYSTNNSFTNSFMNNVYEGLVRFNEKWKLSPLWRSPGKPPAQPCGVLSCGAM